MLCLPLKFPVVHPGLRSGKNFSQCLADGLRGSNLAPQHSVQIECGADPREMCKGLGKNYPAPRLWGPDCSE